MYWLKWRFCLLKTEKYGIGVRIVESHSLNRSLPVVGTY